ncbi:MAG: hypothetical protein QFF03_01085 [Pseudomonadota bacterium]|nr:hypothetical protein [Pseudomonadota bacterium]
MKRQPIEPRIVVDQQSQLNQAQKNLRDYFISASKVQIDTGPRLPLADFSGVPNILIEFSAGTKNYVTKRAIDRTEQQLPVRASRGQKSS